MKIYIPFANHNQIGGPFTFMRNLRKEFDRINYEYAKSPLFAEGMFFHVRDNLRHIKLVKALGGKIIQRLDGVYYPDKSGPGYANLNAPIKEIYENYADYHVFQSKYARDSVFQMIGEVSEDKYTIINNGTDSEIFFPNEKKDFDKKIIFATSGSFRGADMLSPIIESLEKLKDVNFELKIIGPIDDENKKYLEKKYVNHYIFHDQNKIAEELRNSDIFLFTQLNPACSNSVLEAIACGLPVVGFDTGSMGELCHFNSDLLVHLSDDTFKKFEDYDSKNLAEKISQCITHFKKYKTQALKHNQDYSMTKCAEKYIEFFNKIEKKPITIKGYIYLAYYIFTSLLRKTIRMILQLVVKTLNFIKPMNLCKRYVKNLAQKGVYEFLDEECAKIKKDAKVLLVGSGGSIGACIDKWAEKKSFHVTSIDIDDKRNPDIVADICSYKFKSKYDYIILPEVLEHFHSPKIATDNMFNGLKKEGKILFTVPFTFPIHDRPYDYYRYTVYGLEYLFNKYKVEYIKENNNWGETVSVLVMRHYVESYKLKYFVVLLGVVMYPIFSLLGKIIKIDNITTGYHGVVSKGESNA